MMPQQPASTADEEVLNAVWNEHLRAEFSAHSADETVATMVASPLINEVSVMIGGDGKEEVYEFDVKYFLPHIPPDIEIVPVSGTIDQERLVDEIVLRFTHTISMDWMLPGIPPSGKRVEVVVVVVQFEGDKMVYAHLYWDQASVLVQLGLLQPGDPPVVGQRALVRCWIGAYPECADSSHRGPLIALASHRKGLLESRMSSP